MMSSPATERLPEVAAEDERYAYCLESIFVPEAEERASGLPQRLYHIGYCNRYRKVIGARGKLLDTQKPKGHEEGLRNSAEKWNFRQTQRSTSRFRSMVVFECFDDSHGTCSFNAILLIPVASHSGSGFSLYLACKMDFHARRALFTY